MDRNRRYGRSTFSATVYRGARWIAEELTSIHFAGIVVCFHSLCVSFRSTLYDSELLGTRTLKSRIHNRHRFSYGSVCSISSIESDLLVIQYTALTYLTKKVLPLTPSVLKDLFDVVFRPLHRNLILERHESTLDLFRSRPVTGIIKPVAKEEKLFCNWLNNNLLWHAWDSNINKHLDRVFSSPKLVPILFLILLYLSELTAFFFLQVLHNFSTSSWLHVFTSR